MSRLPIPGSDDNVWGDVLNDYLRVSHNADGTQADNTIDTNQLKDKAVTNAKLDSSTQSAITKANSSVQSVNGKAPDSSGFVALTASDVSAIPISDKGLANGIATLGSSSTLTTSQLPSSVVSGSLGSGGSADDTAALQAVINATPSGTTLYGNPHAVYTLNGMLTFPNDNVTIDFRGATIRNGAARSGGTTTPSNNNTDTLIFIGSRNNVRVLNGVLTSAQSAFSGTQVPAKIIINGGARCEVAGWEFHDTAAINPAVWVQGGTDHRIKHNYSNGHSIEGFGTTHAVVKGNVLENVLAEGGGVINWTAFGDPLMNVHNEFVENTIRGHSGFAIQDYANNYINCVDSTIARNIIEAPSTGSLTSATGISSIGLGARVDDNLFTDIHNWAIESDGVGLSVRGNHIRWTSASDSHAMGTIGILSSVSVGSDVGSIISGNRIYQADSAIVIPYLVNALVITGNTITEPITCGINLEPATGDSDSAVCSDNVIRISMPTATGNSRFGIKVGSNTTIMGNRIRYDAASYAVITFDAPIWTIGSNVVFTGNAIDGGGRTDSLIGSGAVGLSPTGWRLTGNHFINGSGGLDLTGHSNVRLSNNTGIKNVPLVSIAVGAAMGTSPPTPINVVTDQAGRVAWGSGTATTTGVLMTVTFQTAYDTNPFVSLTPNGAAAQALGLYIANVTTGGFQICCAVAPAISQSVATYECDIAVRMSE